MQVQGWENAKQCCLIQVSLIPPKPLTMYLPLSSTSTVSLIQGASTQDINFTAH